MRKIKIKPALRISSIYIIIGFLWILLSGKLVLLITDDISKINLIETYKGWFFVIITGTLLYILIKKEIIKRNLINQELIKAKEKAEESNKLKSAFILNISHEIRTPLNAILGFSDLIKNKELVHAKREKYVQYIKLRGNDLINIIDDLIDISRIESNTLEINKKEFDSNHVLDELYSHYNKLLKSYSHKNIELKLQKPLKNERINIYNDESRFKQVFKNLLNNAVKFTEEGKIEFGYFIENEKIIFFVSDTGIGISRGNNEKLFKRFSQVDSALTRRFGGLGIGLAITKSIVEMLGGKIWFETEENIGTTFYFTLETSEVESNI